MEPVEALIIGPVVAILCLLMVASLNGKPILKFAAALSFHSSIIVTGSILLTKNGDPPWPLYGQMLLLFTFVSRWMLLGMPQSPCQSVMNLFLVACALVVCAIVLGYAVFRYVQTVPRHQYLGIAVNSTSASIAGTSGTLVDAKIKAADRRTSGDEQSHKIEQVILHALGIFTCFLAKMQSDHPLNYCDGDLYFDENGILVAGLRRSMIQHGCGGRNPDPGQSRHIAIEGQDVNRNSLDHSDQDNSVETEVPAEILRQRSDIDGTALKTITARRQWADDWLQGIFTLYLKSEIMK